MWLELKEHLGSLEQMAYQVFQEREERQASPDNPVPPDWTVPRDLPDSQGSEAETDPQVGQGVMGYHCETFPFLYRLGRKRCVGADQLLDYS